MFKSFVENQASLEMPLVLANCYNVTWESGVDILSLRDTEQQLVATGANYEYVAVYDIRP